MKITQETRSYKIDGRGSWSVADSIIIEGHIFFLMRNDKHGDRLEKIVMDENAVIIIDNNEDELEPYVVNRLMQHLHNERPSIRDKLSYYRQGGNS